MSQQKIVRDWFEQEKLHITERRKERVNRKVKEMKTTAAIGVAGVLGFIAYQLLSGPKR